MKLQNIAVWAALSQLVLMPGCATMFGRGPDFVMVNSLPEGARVILDGVPAGTTPVTLAIPRDWEGLIEIEKDGYLNTSRNLDKQINPPFLINGLLGILLPVGVVVDLFGHNQGKYPSEPIFVQLVPRNYR